MPRPSYPPHDFNCPYEHNCPYLDWMSTTWVLGEYRRAGETYREHLRIIDIMDAELNTALKRIRSLEKENAELKAKNTALHRRQFKANRKKDTDESGRDAEDIQIHTDGGKKKRGAPVGHPGVQPTNNQAEQSIRFLVIFRKIMFGTRSSSGLRTHSILPGLVLTAMRQGLHPRKFLQTLLTSDTATAQASLYCNSS